MGTRGGKKKGVGGGERREKGKKGEGKSPLI